MRCLKIYIYLASPKEQSKHGDTLLNETDSLATMFSALMPLFCKSQGSVFRSRGENIDIWVGARMGAHKMCHPLLVFPLFYDVVLACQLFQHAFTVFLRMTFNMIL